MRAVLRDKLVATQKIWCSVREELGLKGSKFGIVAEANFEQFCFEKLDGAEIKQAMRNFLQDPWWNGEGKKWQDLNHFIRHYPEFTSDVYNAAEVKAKSRYQIQRD